MKLSVEEKLKRDFALFDEVGRSGIQIDAVKALREDRDRDNAVTKLPSNFKELQGKLLFSSVDKKISLNEVIKKAEKKEVKRLADGS